MIQRIIKLRLAGPVKTRHPYILPGHCGEIWSMYEGIVTTLQHLYAVEHKYAIDGAGIHHAIAVSASVNPPSSGPTSSDLTGLEPFISSTSSSSDIQPSEMFGVFSAGNCLVLLDSSLPDIFARTSWYRSNLASWAGKVVVVAG